MMAIRGSFNPTPAPVAPLRPVPTQQAVDGSSALALPEPDTAPLEGTIEPEQLVMIEPSKRLEVFTTTGGLEPIIQAIAIVARKHKPDISTKRGREAIASNAYKVARCKSLLDDVGKEETAKAKTIPNQIDAARRDMRTKLEAVQAEVRRPLTEWEDDQDRQLRFVEEISLRPLGMNESTAEQLAAAIADLEGLGLSAAPDMRDQAESAKREALDTLQAMLTKRRTYEAEQAELIRLREEQAKRDQEEREAQIRREAEDAARRVAEARAQTEKEASDRREREAREAVERAEREKAEAEQRARETEERRVREQHEAEARAERERLAAAEREEQARQEAAKAERDRQAATQAKEEAERKAREEDHEHRKMFNREALEDIRKALTESDTDPAVSILTAIAKGQVRHTSIAY